MSDSYYDRTHWANGARAVDGVFRLGGTGKPRNVWVYRNPDGSWFAMAHNGKKWPVRAEEITFLDRNAALGTKESEK